MGTSCCKPSDKQDVSDLRESKEKKEGASNGKKKKIQTN